MLYDKEISIDTKYPSKIKLATREAIPFFLENGMITPTQSIIRFYCNSGDIIILKNGPDRIRTGDLLRVRETSYR